ncbi:MAG: class I SAM-dependent methyltransferase [Thiohalomonadales bacterium]|nr:class I SAM-dependent methyltransferase [Thiohalomonadales bacterium]
MNRKSHWDNIYRDKSPLEVSWYQAEPALSLHLIAESGSSKAAAIIDVGGGSSLLVDRLYAQGYRHLAVLDISDIALNHAKQRLGKAAQEIEWFEADVTSFVPPHDYDIWHDRAVFHFLTDKADRRRYVATLKLALKPAGNLILAAFAIGGPTRCSGLDIVQYDAEKLARELGEGFTLAEQQSETHLTPDNQPQLFTYFRFVKDA